jgi:uncharacterized protein
MATRSEITLESRRGVDGLGTARSDVPAARGQSRLERVDQVLTELRHGGGIEGCAVVTRDALIVASALPDGSDETRVAMAASELLELADRAAKLLEVGDRVDMILQGERGVVSFSAIGEEGLLLVQAAPSARLGTIMLRVRTAVRTLEPLL